jgi:hypothetical protein
VTLINISLSTNSKKWLSRIVQVSILVLLFWQLSSVGWVEVYKSLPTNPLFYILQILLYLALPISELFIYKKSWDFKIRNGFPVFVFKKIYNSDVITYSGEIYLYYWAKSKLFHPHKHIASVIRDNNILSTISSTIIAIVLIGIFLSVGHITIHQIIGAEGRFWFPWILLIVIIISIIAWRYRRYWFSMSRKEAGYIFSVHTLRLLIVHTLELIQWIVAIPHIALGNWFSLMAAKIATSRIPLLPNKDLLFLSIVIGLSGAFGIPRAELASMLLVSSVLNKVFNVVFFSWFTVWMKNESMPTDQELLDSKMDYSQAIGEDLPNQMDLVDHQLNTEEGSK